MKKKILVADIILENNLCFIFIFFLMCHFWRIFDTFKKWIECPLFVGKKYAKSDTGAPV